MKKRMTYFDGWTCIAANDSLKKSSLTFCEAPTKLVLGAIEFCAIMKPENWTLPAMPAMTDFARLNSLLIARKRDLP